MCVEHMAGQAQYAVHTFSGVVQVALQTASQYSIMQTCCLFQSCWCGREKAKGATFFEATEGETVRPMLDVSWAPMLGAFSVLFEEYGEGMTLYYTL